MFSKVHRYEQMIQGEIFLIGIATLIGETDFFHFIICIINY